MKINTVISIDQLKQLHQQALTKVSGRTTVSDIYESRISHSFRIYVDGNTINFYQFFKP